MNFTKKIVIGAVATGAMIAPMTALAGTASAASGNWDADIWRALATLTRELTP